MQQTPGPKKRRIGLIVVAVTFLVLIGRFGVWAISRESGLPLLDRGAYEAAKKKWDDSAVTSYDMDVIFTGGLRPKEIHLEVRDGEVTQCLENGRPPLQKRSADNWNVPSQFVMIAEDLDKSERPNGFKVRSNVVITLHGEFDPQYGFPRKYHRKARGNTPLQSQWRIENFKPVGEAQRKDSGG